MRRTSSISSSSMASRPAVSTIRTSRPEALRLLDRPSWLTVTGSDGSLKTGTPAWRPRTRSCSTAAGRCRSAADQQRVAALLLEPAGQLGRRGRLARALEAGEQHHRRRLGRVGDPEGLAAEDRDELVVDDLDDLLGRACRLLDSSAPTAWSRIRDTKVRTTRMLTSACSRARRISRRTSSTSSSLSRPRPRRRVKMASKRSDSESNMQPGRLPDARRRPTPGGGQQRGVSMSAGAWRDPTGEGRPGRPWVLPAAQENRASTNSAGRSRRGPRVPPRGRPA